VQRLKNRATMSGESRKSSVLVSVSVQILARGRPSRRCFKAQLDRLRGSIVRPSSSVLNSALTLRYLRFLMFKSGLNNSPCGTCGSLNLACLAFARRPPATHRVLSGGPRGLANPEMRRTNPILIRWLGLQKDYEYRGSRHELSRDAALDTRGKVQGAGG
jgi:hypothetical protein